MTPSRVGHEPAAAAAAVTIMVAALIALTVGMLTDFNSAWLSAGIATVIGAIAVAFGMTSRRLGPDSDGGRFLVAAIGPLIPITIFLLAVIAYGGPVGAWYWFWMSRYFRVTLFTLTIATVAWTIYNMYSAPAGAALSARIGGILAAVGVGIVSFIGLVPSWMDALRLLNHPLNIAPATETMLFALRTYAGVNIHPRTQILIIGALLVVCGYALCRRSPRPRKPSPKSLLNQQTA